MGHIYTNIVIRGTRGIKKLKDKIAVLLNFTTQEEANVRPNNCCKSFENRHRN